MKMFYSKHTISAGLENVKVRSKLEIKAYSLKVILEYFFLNALVEGINRKPYLAITKLLYKSLDYLKI